MQCCGFQQSLSVPQVSLNTAWPSQLRHVRHRAKNTPNSSTSTPHPPLRLSAITTGHLGDAADDRQHAAPVDYASKDRKQLWKAAIKLPMYSVGVVPVLVSSWLFAAFIVTVRMCERCCLGRCAAAFRWK